MSAEHGGGHGGAGPVIPESDVDFGGVFSRVIDALFLFGLIKYATGNPHYGEPHSGGHGGH